MSRDQYTIEPIDDKNLLDAKRIGEKDGLDRITVTESGVFQMYFDAHQGEDKASWEDVRAWLSSRKYRIRRKTW